MFVYLNPIGKNPATSMPYRNALQKGKVIELMVNYDVLPCLPNGRAVYGERGKRPRNFPAGADFSTDLHSAAGIFRMD